jgi:hypothetical protein
MAFKLDIKPIALIDIDEAIAWYENELNGLGNRFLQKLDEAFNKLRENPQHYCIIQKSMTRFEEFFLKNFPTKFCIW